MPPQRTTAAASTRAWGYFVTVFTAGEAARTHHASCSGYRAPPCSWPLGGPRNPSLREVLASLGIGTAF